MGAGGRVELLSRGIIPVLFPLMAVGFMSPLKSKAGTLFITPFVCTGWILSAYNNRMLFSQRCLSVDPAWRRSHDPSSLAWRSNINLSKIRQAVCHPVSALAAGCCPWAGRTQEAMGAVMLLVLLPLHPGPVSTHYVKSAYQGKGIIFLSLLKLISLQSANFS